VGSLSQVPQLPKAFCGHAGVLECSGLTELWMGRERADGEIQGGVQPSCCKNHDTPRRPYLAQSSLGIGEALKLFPMLKICLSCF
jgi:hypothetical protein